MARKRQIDPEFCVDEDMATISIPARLFYILLWTQAEDTGAVELKLTTLKIKIFPYDNIDIKPFIDELIAKEKLIPYKNDVGRIYLFIKNFHKHQIIQHYSIPKLPLPPEPYRSSIPKKALEDATKELLSHTTHILLIEEYNRIELNRIELNRILKTEPSAEKKTSIFNEKEQVILKSVYKSVNIYALLERFNKEHKYYPPKEVLIKICEQFLKSKVERPYPYLKIALNKATEEWFAQQNIKEGEQWKNAPIADSIKQILKGIIK
jgi:hypothetical protein